MDQRDHIEQLEGSQEDWASSGVEQNCRASDISRLLNIAHSLCASIWNVLSCTNEVTGLHTTPHIPSAVGNSFILYYTVSCVFGPDDAVCQLSGHGTTTTAPRAESSYMPFIRPTPIPTLVRIPAAFCIGPPASPHPRSRSKTLSTFPSRGTFPASLQSCRRTGLATQRRLRL